MPRIVLEGVSKSFAGPNGKSVTAVDAFTLEVKDRELLALVGPSGCGKTTTLRLIAGLETADSGRILFDDKQVTRLPPVERDVAMVFQSHALFPHFTAFENIAFGLTLRHVSRTEIVARVRETADWLSLTHCLDRKPGNLSGGERQRVALGRALVRRPKILLLDEPLSHLDEPLRLELRAELLALRSRLDTTVIYVTHDQAEALALGDRVAVLQHGRLQQIGPPHEVYQAPANTFVAGFIGSAPMNLFQGTIARGEGGVVFLGDKAKAGASSPEFLVSLGNWQADWFSKNVGRPVLLAVRPDCMRLTPEKAQASVANTITAVVESIQFAGAERCIHLNSGAVRIVARTPTLQEFRTGQTVTVTVDLERVRLYDAATGKLIL